MEDMEDISPIMSPIIPSANVLQGAFSYPLSGPNDIHSTQAIDRNDSNSVLLNSGLVPDQTGMTTTKKGHLSWRRLFSWRVSTRRILSICFLVTIPMVAFTTTILWLIFGNLISAAVCPYPELCPDLSATNGTDSRDNYYVDFSNTRLVFIASRTSSLSLMLVAALMSIYSYATAAQLRQISELDPPTKRLPTPYQMTLLFRVLNAEFMTLIGLITLKLKKVFWDRQSDDGLRKQSSIVRASVIVFASGIAASAFIQAADTYLHLATEAVEALQIKTEDPSGHLYSRGLAPWCNTRPTVGHRDNPNFWGCGLTINTRWLAASNKSSVLSLSTGVSEYHDISDFVDKDGLFLAILIPKGVKPSIDWSATSFAVSTKCYPLRNSSCELTTIPDVRTQSRYSFSCSSTEPKFSTSGVMDTYTQQRRYYNWHRYVEEQPPFAVNVFQSSEALTSWMRRAQNFTDNEAEQVFSNPWQMFSAIKRYGVDNSDTIESDSDRLILRELQLIFAYCNITVWDVEYKAVGPEIVHVTRKRSNSSTTGISSMPSAEIWKQFPADFQRARDKASVLARTSKEFVETYSQGVSRALLLPFAGQVEPRPALLVQSRSSKIVSKVPKAAVWVLVVSNILFLSLAVGLTVFALVVSSKDPDVHQVHTRLGISGLASQLFEEGYSQRKVKDSEELFEEHTQDDEKLYKKVRVEITDEGGAQFRTMRD